METLAVTINDAAKVVNLSPRKVRSLIKAGRIDARKEGRRVLVMKDALNKYLQSLPSAASKAA